RGHADRLPARSRAAPRPLLERALGRPRALVPVHGSAARPPWPRLPRPAVVAPALARGEPGLRPGRALRLPRPLREPPAPPPAPGARERGARPRPPPGPGARGRIRPAPAARRARAALAGRSPAGLNGLSPPRRPAGPASRTSGARAGRRASRPGSTRRGP